MRNQAYKLKLAVKWCIYHLFYLSLLEKDVKRSKAVDQKIHDQLELEEREELRQAINSIVDSKIFAEGAIDDKLPYFYNVKHWNTKTNAEVDWEPLEKVAHLL